MVHHCARKSNSVLKVQLQENHLYFKQIKMEDNDLKLQAKKKQNIGQEQLHTLEEDSKLVLIETNTNMNLSSLYINVTVPDNFL